MPRVSRSDLPLSYVTASGSLDLKIQDRLLVWPITDGDGSYGLMGSVGVYVCMSVCVYRLRWSRPVMPVMIDDDSVSRVRP
jgi:hypothetical protein